jgi:transposase-like protein
MRRRTEQGCLALALAILWVFSTVSVAHAGKPTLTTTLLKIQPLDPFVVGQQPIVFVRLTTAMGKPIPDKAVELFLNEIHERTARTDVTGTVSFRIRRNLPAGTYTLRATWGGSQKLASTKASTQIVIKPAEFEIHTIPPLSGVSFSLAGHIFSSNASGIARIQITQPGLSSLRVLPLDKSQSDIQADFDRWGDGVFTPSREVKLPLDKPLEVGFEVRYKVSPTFVDLADRPVAPGRVGSLTIQGAGVTYVFQDGQPRWLLSSRVSRGADGLEETKILYSVVSVVVDGANVVSEAQQRFHAQPNDVWPIKLLLYSAHFISRDALFHFPIGSGIVLNYPDGHSQEFPFYSSNELTIGSLARGLYHVTVTGAKGMAPPTPLALSRDQDLELLVLSNLDLSVMFAVAASIALGLLFFGRPHLLTILVRLPFYLFRKRQVRRLQRVPVFESLYTSDLRQCPSCQATAKQTRAGLNRSGSQRYRCHMCGRVYTPAPNSIGFSAETRERALQLYLEGNSRQAIAHSLNVSPRTVSKWIVNHTLQLPVIPAHEPAKVVDVDDRSASMA